MVGTVNDISGALAITYFSPHQSQCLCPNGPTLFHSGSGGDSTCIQCGVVVAENALVSEVSFGETSGGAAIAHGTLVAEGSSGFIAV